MISQVKALPVHRVKRVGKFGAVGVINTLMDFTIYNLALKFLGVPPVVANIFSATTAMLFSFFANKHIVFSHSHGSVAKQGFTFLLVTGFGLYVLQTSIIFFLAHVWQQPLQIGVSIVRGLGIHFFSDAFYINNGAKAAATLVSLTWNYIMYKKVVFSHG